MVVAGHLSKYYLKCLRLRGGREGGREGRREGGREEREKRD